MAEQDALRMAVTQMVELGRNILIERMLWRSGFSQHLDEDAWRERVDNSVQTN